MSEMSKSSTIYFEPEIHHALRIKVGRDAKPNFSEN